MNIRLDTFLVEKKGIASREKAKQLISDGKILINGLPAKKASYNVKEGDEVNVEDTYIYVSRAAHKLIEAMKIWRIEAKMKICLDIGSSTGGFTEVLLQNGARKVYAVDVGVNQLHESVKNDDRVVSIEGKDFRELNKDEIIEPVELIVIDVSFISLSHIIPLLGKFGDKGMEVVALLKPQFEVGKQYLKKGIVNDQGRVEEVKQSTVELFINEGFDVKPYGKSPIKGKEGNQEYLLYARKL